MNGLLSSMRVMSCLDVPFPHRQAGGFVRHAHALDHAAVLGFGGFGALQRLAQPCGLVARAHRFGQRQRFGLRLAHVRRAEEAGDEDREHGDRVAFEVRPPAAVVGRQHRRDEHQQRAERRDQRDVPVPVRGQREHHGEQVTDADGRVQHVGDVDGEDRRAHHQQPRQQIAAAVQVAAQALADRVAPLFFGHLDQAAQVVAQAECAEQQQRHQEVAERVHRQVRLAEEPADRRALALQRQVEQQHAVGAVGDAIEKVRVAGDLFEARCTDALGFARSACGRERGLSAGRLLLRIRRERVLQVRGAERFGESVERFAARSPARIASLMAYALVTATSAPRCCATTFFCCRSGAPTIDSSSTSTRIATIDAWPAMTPRRFFDILRTTAGAAETCVRECDAVHTWLGGSLNLKKNSRRQDAKTPRKNSERSEFRIFDSSWRLCVSTTLLLIPGEKPAAPHPACARRPRRITKLHALQLGDVVRAGSSRPR